LWVRLPEAARRNSRSSQNSKKMAAAVPVSRALFRASSPLWRSLPLSALRLRVTRIRRRPALRRRFCPPRAAERNEAANSDALPRPAQRSLTVRPPDPSRPQRNCCRRWRRHCLMSRNHRMNRPRNSVPRHWPPERRLRLHLRRPPALPRHPELRLHWRRPLERRLQRQPDSNRLRMRYRRPPLLQGLRPRPTQDRHRSIRLNRRSNPRCSSCHRWNRKYCCQTNPPHWCSNRMYRCRKNPPRRYQAELP